MSELETCGSCGLPIDQAAANGLGQGTDASDSEAASKRRNGSQSTDSAADKLVGLTELESVTSTVSR